MPTEAEFVIERLANNGVRHVFNVSGGYSLPFCKRLEKSQLELVDTTSEAAAGFAADAYARINGMSAVCVTYCVGGFSLINSIGGAFAEKSPIVVISGSPGVKERNTDVLLHHMVRNFECQHKVFQNITCASTVLDNTVRAAYEIDRVIEAAKSYKQPVYIEMPRDMVDKAVSYDPYTVGTPPSLASNPETLQEVLEEVTDWIGSAKKPVIWAGVEVARYGLGQKVMKFAEHNNIPMATDVLGKSAVNEKHPLSFGVYSESMSRKEVVDVFAKSDCIIMLGVMMTDMALGFLPLRCKRRNTINASSRSLYVKGHNYPNVQFPDFVEALCKTKFDKRESITIPPPVFSCYEPSPGSKLKVVRLMQKINSILDENTAVIADVGDALFGAIDLTIHRHNQFLASAFYMSMGFAVPGALGVQLANPKLRPIVIVGDGSFQMTGMEFSTLIKRRLNPIVFVLNNDGYGTERLNGFFNNSQNWNYEKMPDLVGGGHGFRVETEDDLERAVNTALMSKQASLLNCVIDRDDYTPSLTRMFSKLADKASF